MAKISELDLLTELTPGTFVPVVDLVEVDKEKQNKRASPEVFKGPKGDQGEQGEQGIQGIQG
ncbi:MAG: hypothetical protein M0R77_01235, partial [Gammaproteobacteria bacterium]|nr:hypothetical protein [Gammaproteobacteria bacterium]